MRQTFLLTMAILWYSVGIFASTVRRSSDPGPIVKLPLFKRLDYSNPGTTRYLASVWIDGVRFDLQVHTASNETWAWSDLMEDFRISNKGKMRRHRSPAFGNTQRTAEDEYQPVLHCKKDLDHYTGVSKEEWSSYLPSDKLTMQGYLGTADNVTIGSLTLGSTYIRCASKVPDHSKEKGTGARELFFAGVDGVLGLAPVAPIKIVDKGYIFPRFLDTAFGSSLKRTTTIDLYDDFEWKEPLSRVVFNTCECDDRKDSNTRVIKIKGPENYSDWIFGREGGFGEMIILDSSKTNIGATYGMVNEYYKDIKFKKIDGYHYVPCNTTMKPLRLRVRDGHEVVIDGKFLLGDKIPGLKGLKDYCQGGLQYANDGKFHYGIPFFRSQTICFTEIKNLGSVGKDGKNIPWTTDYQITHCDKPK